MPIEVIALAILVLLLTALIVRRAMRAAPQSVDESLLGLEIRVNRLMRLFSPDEQRYLRENLLPADFRRVQRQRMKVALAYLAELNDALPNVDDPVIQRLQVLIFRCRLHALHTWLRPRSIDGSGRLIERLKAARQAVKA